MKTFQCQHCGNAVYFENTECLSCNRSLGYEPVSGKMLAGDVGILPTSENGANPFKYEMYSFRYCSNRKHGACNWLLQVDDEHGLCEACRLNRTIPNLSVDEHLVEWQKLERAKHRLMYALKRWELPIVPKTEDENGLAFDFLSEEDVIKRNQSSMTGHANGIITINVSEADAIHREQLRQEMEESYRTLIGHFRHEVGHYYWDRLIATDNHSLIAFRETFGDERADYGEALKKHYKNLASENWKSRYISKYASSHPWEDWAETWAHYLHLVDMLDTALNFGLLTQKTTSVKDAYTHDNFSDIFETIVPLSLAVNSLNRSMGQPDIYPFIIPDNVKHKLQFVHSLLHKLDF